MRNTILIFMLSVVFSVAMIYGGGSRPISVIQYANFTTSTDGDTAAVLFFELNSATASAADSFVYLDSFVVGPTPDTFLATYVSPSQVMIFTLTGNTGDVLKLDTVGIGVVGCTVNFAAQELGIEYDLSTGDDSTIATAYDSIVDIINKRTNLKDSVLASDSGTYIKIASKYTQDEFTARWSILMTSDSTDTASNITTEAEVSAGMAAAINAEDSISFYVTAVNSGDTGVFVTSDDPGLEVVVFLGDTARDTTRTQANVTSSSQMTDTMFNYPIGLSDDDFRALGINGDIVLDTATTDSADGVIGLGTSDSASLWVRSYRDSGGVRIYRNLDSIIGDTIPLTLHLARIPAWANDTVFFDGLVISWYISDTLTAVVVTRKYPIYIDLNLTEM